MFSLLDTFLEVAIGGMVLGKVLDAAGLNGDKRHKPQGFHL